jgi:hypothetical protein
MCLHLIKENLSETIRLEFDSLWDKKKLDLVSSEKNPTKDK